MIGKLTLFIACALLRSAFADEAVSWWDGASSWFGAQDGNESRELQEVRPLPDDMEHYERGNLYPTESLQCYSSLTEPRHRLICPASRSKFCVKEVVGLQQDLCGKTQFFGDLYIDSRCILKMCAAECIPGDSTFEYGGNKYARTTYCCRDKDYCNSAPSAFNVEGLKAFMSFNYVAISLCCLLMYAVMLN